MSAPFLNHRLKLRDFVRLVEQPAGPEGFGVRRQFVVLAAGLQRGERRFGTQHAGLHGRVAALDAAGVQIASIAADQRAAGEHGFRQAQDAACRDGARVIADALATFDVLADAGVGIPALHLSEREPRVTLLPVRW